MYDELQVLTFGVFDCLHEGHLDLFEKLNLLGRVNVAVVKDAAVKRVKGENKPIMNENYRVRLVGKIKGVYSAFLVEDFDFGCVKMDQYALVAIGEDQKHFKGLENVPFEKRIILPRTEGISTSEIIKKLKD